MPWLPKQHRRSRSEWTAVRRAPQPCRRAALSHFRATHGPFTKRRARRRPRGVRELWQAELEGQGICGESGGRAAGQGGRALRSRETKARLPGTQPRRPRPHAPAPRAVPQRSHLLGGCSWGLHPKSPVAFATCSPPSPGPWNGRSDLV